MQRELTSTVMGGSGMGVSLLITVSPIDTSEMPVIMTISPVIKRREEKSKDEIKCNMWIDRKCSGW